MITDFVRKGVGMFYKWLCIALLSLFCLAGCAAKISTYATPRMERIFESLEPGEDKTLVYVIMTGGYSEYIIVYTDRHKGAKLLVQGSYEMYVASPRRTKNNGGFRDKASRRS